MGRRNKQSTTKSKSSDRKSSGRKARNVIEYTNEPDDETIEDF